MRASLLRRSPFVLLAAALVVLAVLLAHDASPASAQVVRVPPVAVPEGFYVYQGTMTVGNGSGWKGYSSGGSVGTLPDATFTFDGTDYEIERLSVTDDGATLQLVFDKAIPERVKSSLTLIAGSYHYRLSNATLANVGGTTDDSATWANRRQSWSVGDEVKITISASNLWSATLTVGDIRSGLLFGCDDTTSNGPDCSSAAALTDNTFTYGGVDYQVINLTESDVGSTIGFGLDKTIPDSLDNLVLHAGDRRLLFGDGYKDTSSVTNDIMGWDDTGLTWSVGDTVELRLTERQTPKHRVFYRSATIFGTELENHGIRGSSTVCVGIDPPLKSASSVHVRIKEDSTATQWDDYAILLPDVPGTTDTKVLQLPYGEALKCFGLTFRRDMLTEGDEVIDLELVAIADAPYVVAEDDFTANRFPATQISIFDISKPIPADADPRRGVNIQPKSATVRTGSKVTYSISLNSRPDDDVEVGAFLDGSDGGKNLGHQVAGHLSATPSTLIFTPTNWATPQFFTLSTGGVEPGRYVVLHRLYSDDDDYRIDQSLRGPGIDGRTHIVIEVTDGTSPEAPPGAPKSLGAAVYATDMSLFWAKPSASGTVIGYDVHYTSSLADEDEEASGSDPTVGWVDANHTGIIPTHWLADLIGGVAYRVRVRAVTPNVNGAWARYSATTSAVWSATLNVATDVGGRLGCSTVGSSCESKLGERDGFTVGGKSYKVIGILSRDTGGTLDFGLDQAANAKLKAHHLCVGTRSFAFSSATYIDNGTTARWTSLNPKLTWVVSNNIQFSIKGACGVMGGSGVDGSGGDTGIIVQGQSPQEQEQQQDVGSGQQQQSPQQFQAPSTNRAPTVSSPLSDVNDLTEGATKEVSLSGVFSDADGDSLTITASSDYETVATVSVSSDYSKLTLTGVSSGIATITVVAQDPDGARAVDEFNVEVVDAPQQQVQEASADPTPTPEPEPKTQEPQPQMQQPPAEPETQTDTPTSEPETETSNIVDQYDTNGDGSIDLSEYSRAANDYIDGKITYSEMVEIATAYRAS